MKRIEISSQEKIGISFIALLIFYFYWLTYSSVPTSDGYTWIQNIDSKNWTKIFLPNHLLSEFFILIVKNIFLILGATISTLKVIQILNASLAALSSLLFYWLERKMGLKSDQSLLGMLFFAFTFSLWYFANGEIHHLGLFVILWIFVLLVRFRYKPSFELAMSIGLLYALASSLHQEHFLFVFPIAWMMLSGKRIQFNVPFFLVYFGVSAIVTMGVYGTVAQTIFGVGSLTKFKDWFFMFTYTKADHMNVMLLGEKWLACRLLKGFLMNINYGAQIIVDCLRYSSVRLSFKAVFLAILTLTAFVVLIIKFIQSILVIRKEKSELRIYLLGCLIWLITYESFLYLLKISPESPEYHLVATVPFLLLVLKAAFYKQKPKPFSRGMIFVLFSTLVVNSLAGVIPWKRYGNMVERFSEFSKTNFKESDFFISTESGLDPIVRAQWKYLSIKDLFMMTDKKEAFRQLAGKIAAEVSQGHRLFIYNFIPGDYALKSIRLYQREPVGRQEFIDAWKQINAQYKVSQTFPYWEINYSQIYLFDPTKDMVWEIARRTS